MAAVTPWPRGCRPLSWPDEVDELLELVEHCHPERQPREALHYFAHPTIVVDDAVGLVGYAVLTMAPAMPEGGVTVPAVYGVDCGVHERARGTGLGTLLLQLRFAIGRQCGAVIAAGTVNPANRHMAAIHRAVGMDPKGDPLKGVFTDVTPPADGQVMMAGPLALDEAVVAVFHDPLRRWDKP